MTGNCTLQWYNSVFRTLTIDSGAYVSVICEVASPLHNSLLVEDNAILNMPAMAPYA